MSASSSKTRYIHCGKFQYQSGGDERTGKLTAEENGWLEKYEKKKGKEMIKVDKLCIKMLYETIEKKDKEIAKQTEQINKLKEKQTNAETKPNAINPIINSPKAEEEPAPAPAPAPAPEPIAHPIQPNIQAVGTGGRKKSKSKKAKKTRKAKKTHK